ncbi:RNase adapter RapZ [Alphaproteobacteria bacterium]|nr:RNase adapter RapZ [Alphaproteobacteria bacterium]
MTRMMDEPTVRRETSSNNGRVILVTGLSGAGRTTCLKTLEDSGFEAVDNLPLSLMPALLTPFAEGHHPPQKNMIAVGVDTRTRDFDAESFLANLDRLRGNGVSVAVVFLDCDDEILIRRFTETRRVHPLAKDRPIADGIRMERNLLAPVRDRADIVIDSSHLSLPDFRQILTNGLDVAGSRDLTITVTSFGFRNGLPREADMVFDVRFLSNPHYDEALRPLDGRDGKIGKFIRKDPGFQGFFDRLTAFMDPLLPRYADEGKSYLTVGIGCTGGRHRSVFVAIALAEWLRAAGHGVTLRHRDLAIAVES